MLDNPSGSGDVEQMPPRNQQTLFFWHPGVVISNTLATVWIPHRGSVVKCARSQVRPFHEDDEAAHEHVTERMRDLGERLLHEGDFSYEDITGQDEPSVDSPPAEGEKHSDQTPGPGGEGPMDVEPDVRRSMRGKTGTVSTEQPTAPLSNATTDTARQETAGDHDDKRRRVDEPEAPISPVAQNEAPILNPVSFVLETRNDEIAVDVPLSEEQVEKSGDHRRSSFYSLATASTATQGGENEPIDTCRIKPPRCHLWKKRPKLESVGRIVRWILVGLVFGSQTTASHLDVGLRHDSSSRVSQILTSSTLNHILRRVPGKAL